MKNAILSAIFIAISYWIANVMPTDGPIGAWSAMASLITGVIGVAIGILAWAEWD
jgi:hypothetical protein